MHIFTRNVPLVSLIFLKRSLVFPILLFSYISFHCCLRKAFLSLFAILWNCIQIGMSFLFSFASNFSSFLNHKSVLLRQPVCLSHLFFLGMVLITVCCTVLPTSGHSSSGTLSIRSNILFILYRFKLSFKTHP